MDDNETNMNETESPEEGIPDLGAQQQGALEPEEGWQPKDILLAIGAFAIIVAIAAGGYFIYQSQKTEPVVKGDIAPDFTMPLLDGGEDSLYNHRGEVVLVNIWATWCGPCREEMPFMENFYKRMEGKPFEILAVSQDRKGEEEVRPFVNEFGITFPVMLDPDKDVGGLYKSDKFPESYIIDKNGKVVERVVGELTSNDLEIIEHLVDNS